MMYAAAAIIVGFQMISLAVFAKVFAINAKLLPEDTRLDFLAKQGVLEMGITAGMLLCFLGLTGSIIAVVTWESTSFGPLTPTSIMRIVIPSVTAVILGMQLIISSFFIALLSIQRR
jgi:hypothetical protein